MFKKYTKQVKAYEIRCTTCGDWVTGETKQDASVQAEDKSWKINNNEVICFYCNETKIQEV